MTSWKPPHLKPHLSSSHYSRTQLSFTALKGHEECKWLWAEGCRCLWQLKLQLFSSSRLQKPLTHQTFLGYSWFYYVLLCFTMFYYVLLCFTMFYYVLLLWMVAKSCTRVRQVVSLVLGFQPSNHGGAPWFSSMVFLLKWLFKNRNHDPRHEA